MVVQLRFSVGFVGRLRQLGFHIKFRPPAPNGERIAGLFISIDELIHGIAWIGRSNERVKGIPVGDAVDELADHPDREK